MNRPSISGIAVWALVLLFVAYTAQMAPLRADQGAGPDHERLNALVGEWQAAIKLWKSPDGEPSVLSGTATRRWVLGGRFLEDIAENETSSGGQFISLGYLGYDRQTRLYERFWMTDTATRVFFERGRYDPDDNLIRLQGAETRPSGVAISTVSEIKLISPDQHVFTAYVTGPSGVRWKQLEIVYTKK